MPQGGDAGKLEPQKSDNARSSSNSAKRQNFGVQNPAIDNSKPGSKIPTLRGMPKSAPGITTLRGIGPSTPKLPPKPTGSASASRVKPRSSLKKSRSVGPQAITRPVNQMQMASRLNADQQQARRDQTPGLGPTREEMLADSGNSAGGVLPGQFDALAGSGAYGREATSPPGSMAETPEIDTEKGGGVMKSDLENQRAMQLQQSQMAAVRQSAGSTSAEAGLPALSGVAGAVASGTEKPQQSGIVGEAAEKVFPMGKESQDKGSAELQTAQKLTQAMGMERTAKTIETARNIKGNIQAAQKVAKTLKNFWNLIKAGELAAGISVVSLILLIVTANLQMINKYTFKNKLIPETYLVEDAAIVCFDCGGCLSICFNVFTISVLISVFVGMLILIGGLYGLDYFGVLSLVDLSF
jgi:hypothetical protein